LQAQCTLAQCRQRALQFKIDATSRRLAAFSSDHDVASPDSELAALRASSGVAEELREQFFAARRAVLTADDDVIGAARVAKPKAAQASDALLAYEQCVSDLSAQAAGTSTVADAKRASQVRLALCTAFW
jgi:hypothetical protein